MERETVVDKIQQLELLTVKYKDRFSIQELADLEKEIDWLNTLIEGVYNV